MSKVLVVEDDPAILDAVAYNLKRDGHEVLTATDGLDGLQLAREAGPDLVLLDLMLPRMSGLDVCRILRSERPVPILMLTARDTEVDKVVGLELGADDYLTKPFSMRELMARVAAVLRRDRMSREAGHETPSARSETIEGGDIALNISAHEARRAGEVVPLRPKEFDLLEFLMRHPGQVLTREMILETVWGYSYGGETRTVDVHIRWLREKLEADPAHPAHIQTVRSVGYKFVP
ncbi:MAG: response regulator transcription factor [Dehalococcoidia bacterium]|nr:response regulator transcription factor [Dehalococcoidia bacterium]HRC62900.1 response regulator transcription factor [Dehalococcoidia bacterium]